MKNGFTLIELVFTIVILAITTMAIPRIVAQTVNLNMFAVQQELVYNAKSMMSRIQPAKWDSNYIVVDCGSDSACKLPPMIHTVAADEAAARPGINKGYNTVTGGGIDPGMRKISLATPTPYANFGIGANAISFGDATNYNDVDDYNGFAHVLNVDDLVTGDFVLTTNTAVRVDYVVDPIDAASNYANSVNLAANFSDTFANGNPTDVKLVSVTSTNAADGASVVLRYYTFNIGVENQTVAYR